MSRLMVVIRLKRYEADISPVSIFAFFRRAPPLSRWRLLFSFCALSGFCLTSFCLLSWPVKQLIISSLYGSLFFSFLIASLIMTAFYGLFRARHAALFVCLFVISFPSPTLDLLFSCSSFLFMIASSFVSMGVCLEQGRRSIVFSLQ